MLYAIEQGPIEQSVIVNCQRTRRPLPPSILNAPRLSPGLEIFFAAFFDLSSCRVMGGPIPWQATWNYATAYGYSEEQEEDLQYYITRMDGEYLQHMSKKAPKP